MQGTMLNRLALGVGTAAVSGYGLGIGRDAWKATKRNLGLIILLLVVASALALPFLGGRNIARGYPRGALWQSAWGVLSGFLMIVAGASLSVGSAFVLGVTLDDPRGSGGIAPAAVILGGGAAAAAAVIGMVAGLMQRPRRRRKFDIARKNEAFLAKLGFVETGEQEITHYDGLGSPLRLLEVTDDSIVFLAVGRRNKRAYIGLSPEGEMNGYTGVISVMAPREYLWT